MEKLKQNAGKGRLGWENEVYLVEEEGSPLASKETNKSSAWREGKGRGGILREAQDEGITRSAPESRGRHLKGGSILSGARGREAST